MRRLVVFVGLVAALALVVTACGGGSTASPSPATSTATIPSAAPTAAPTPLPTAAPTEAIESAEPSEPVESEEPSESAGPISSFAIPSFNADTELEALLPNEFRGEKVQKFSFKGDATMVDPSDPQNKALIDLLSKFGKSPSDISIAVGSTPSAEVSFAAFRINGVPADQWFPLFIEASKQEQPGTTTETMSLGGKSITKVTQPDTEMPTYAYPKGDVVFIVGAKADDAAAEGLGLLP